MSTWVGGGKRVLSDPFNTDIAKMICNLILKSSKPLMNRHNTRITR